MPDWITKYLGHHLKHDLKQEKSISDMSIDEVRKIYQEYKKANEDQKRSDTQQSGS